MAQTSTCKAGDLSSIPGSGRSPGEGNGYATQFVSKSLHIAIVLSRNKHVGFACSFKNVFNTTKKVLFHVGGGNLYHQLYKDSYVSNFNYTLCLFNLLQALAGQLYNLPLLLCSN